MFFVMGISSGQKQLMFNQMMIHDSEILRML